MGVVDFVNEALTDFSQPESREAFAHALAQVDGEIGREYPLVIGGERVTTGEWIESLNPSAHAQVVGRVARAGPAEADRAVHAAEKAFEGWSRVPASERARVGLRAAAVMRRRRHELSATMVLEVGKSWIEADADTAEAIDFLEFYSRHAALLGAPQPLTMLRGTDNELLYLPLGVGLAIPPWNFPLAIATGLVSSGILAGNAMVFKPASVAPIIAAKIVEVFEEAGLPAGVLNFLPGPGDTVGDRLVADARVRFVNFTGSRDVGVHINELAAKVQPGQKWLKRVVAEMGGKDAIVVDQSADLELAASGIVASAFGFQGQKCSAASRVIADVHLYDELVERVARRTEALRVGPAREQSTDVGPVVDRSQYRKVVEYIGIGRGEGRVVAGGEADDSTGYFVQPTVIADAAPDSRIMQEEIFGPLLAMCRASDFDEALAIANGTVYGLTGGVYARDPMKLAQARRELHVGNLYFNRKITGALVGVEPFGGFNMSGTDSKAGGDEYLKLFMQAKVISEKL
ncbi:MAG: 1-pyrroline-5-carboxylate dehydrogenase [Chloroflexota bacterium]|jgi:1-pyrroline-5-carboxylate dehydrogenase|nr:1-pyrroline-5-carboxylate dehydrogenase [Chloroflexota bacterium]